MEASLTELEHFPGAQITWIDLGKCCLSLACPRDVMDPSICDAHLLREEMHVVRGCPDREQMGTDILCTCRGTHSASCKANTGRTIYGRSQLWAAIRMRILQDSVDLCSAKACKRTSLK